jgi:hypothetical protein
MSNILYEDYKYQSDNFSDNLSEDLTNNDNYIENNDIENNDTYFVIVKTSNIIKNLLYIIKYIVIFISISIIFCDISILSNKNRCIYQKTYIHIEMYKYLLVSIYSYLILFTYMFYYVICIKNMYEHTPKNIILIYLIYKLYLFIVNIMGFVIFFNIIDNSLCNQKIYDYIISTLIIKLLLLFLIHILI